MRHFSTYYALTDLSPSPSLEPKHRVKLPAEQLSILNEVSPLLEGLPGVLDKIPRQALLHIQPAKRCLHLLQTSKSGIPMSSDIIIFEKYLEVRLH